jgi:hypothetical protein
LVRCPPTVPTVSHWGLITLGLVLAVGGKIYFKRRKPIAQTQRIQ